MVLIGYRVLNTNDAVKQRPLLRLGVLQQLPQGHGNGGD
jgi:hypothetical protein